MISMSSDITIQDVFRQFLPEYSETKNFSPQQLLVSQCIMKCRTIEMGANLSECENCHKKYIHYNSCKNRHCPMCQGMDVDEWIDKQQENVLDVPYFHTVFTVPEELYSLIYSNQKFLYDALYHAAHLTMTELSADPKHLGARIGYICVLHTWGSRMNYHPHLHTIVLGGGLDSANKWKDKRKKFFFSVKVMSAVFKKYYLRELKQLWEEGKLEYHGTAEHLQNHYEFKALLDNLYDKPWVVYTKEAFNGANSVINYLGRYTHRIAISNRRIVSMTDETVTYLVKNYPDIKLQKYDAYAEAKTAFENRNGVAWANDNTEVIAFAIENEGFEVGIPSLGSADTIAPAVTKGNETLLDWSNDEIVSLGEEKFFHTLFEFH